MADGLTTQTAAPSTIPDATKVATDDAGAAGHVQIVKLAISADGSATVLPGDAANGLDVDVTRVTGTVTVDQRPSVTQIQVSQTTTATAYEAKDAIGGLMTFANAARTSGGAIHIEGVTIVDEDSQDAAVDLVLFKASVTAPTDEAAFDPTDAELLDCIGVIEIAASDYSQFNDNSVAHKDCALTAKLTGTSLFGVLVARGTPTYASTSSIHVTLAIVQD